MDQSYMKKDKILPLLLKMALPMLISMMVNSLYNIVDSLFVAKLSENAMTALSLVFPVQNLINSVMVGFGIGINSLISFYMGAQNNKMANKAASQGMFLATIHGVIFTVVSIIIMPSFLKLFTSDTDVINLGVQYSNIAFAFSVILAWELVFEKTFQAVGRMKVSMVCMMTGCIVNIVLDPIMIFGIGFIPAMGIQGAALATGIGQTTCAIMYLVLYKLRPIPVKYKRQYIKLEKGIFGKLYSVGIPASLNMALPSLQVSVLNIILSSYSQVYVFILGVYYKLQTFLYLPANGVVQGMRPLIGYNYGAGEHKRVHKIYNTALALVVAIMAVGTILCLSIPTKLIALFTINTDTINIGAIALRIISAGFIVSTVSVVSSGALEGLGKGMPSLIISLCRYVIIMLPVAFIASLIYGANGVWNAFWVTELISAIIAHILFKRVK